MQSLNLKPTQFSKLFTVALLSVSTFFITSTYAETEQSQKQQNENIEVTQQNVTDEELAAIFVLSEICPDMTKQDEKFTTGYNLLLADYLPGNKKPLETLKNMSKKNQYAATFKEARADAKKAGEQANLEICQDVINYQSYK